ncbi:MAG: TonB-dependent receptor, partial [Steroidobacteraceae bacterium]
AGVLNIQTLQPTFAASGKAEASYGSQSEHGDYYQMRGTYSGPLTETLAGRISFAKTERDGSTKNLYDGKYTNGSDRIGARGQLLFKGDDLSLRVIADYHEEDSPCCQGILYSPGPDNGSLFYSRVAAVGATAVLDPDYRSAQFNSRQRIQVRQGGGSVEANWSVGDYALTSITAYRNWWFKPTNDADNLTITAIRNVGQLVDNDQWSQELRIASPDGGKVEWVAGLFYFYQYQNNVQFTEYGPDATAYLGSPILNNGSSYLHTYYHKDSYAAFAQATWHVTDLWNVTAGLRQTSEKNTARVRREGYGSPGFVAAFGERSQDELSKKDNDLSALLSVDYTVADDVLAYASVSRGAKAGGINAIFPSAGLTTDSLIIKPEEATDAELGLKSKLWDRRVTLNTNLFWTRVKNYQATQILFPLPGVTVQLLSNVGLVRTRGVETEISAEPIDGLTFALAASFNDATYQSYKDAPCPAEASAAGVTLCDLSGEQVVGAPRWVFNPSVFYTRDLSASLSGYVGADYAWRSSFYGTTDNSELAKVDSYGLLNLRLGLTGEVGGNKWDASLWANNALDKNYVVGGSAQGTHRTYYLWPGLPRLIGATLRVSF